MVAEKADPRARTGDRLGETFRFALVPAADGAVLRVGWRMRLESKSEETHSVAGPSAFQRYGWALVRTTPCRWRL